MANLVHLTPADRARRIVRSGVAARSPGGAGERGVYCMPVLTSYTLTHQWVRELRRWHPGVLAAVDLRISDDEPVLVGRYNREPERCPAARAVALVREAADPRGFEIFVPRAIPAGEVRRVRSVAQRIGWRHKPDAHGVRPCTCPACMQPGTPKSARLRRRLPDENFRSRKTKPELMAQLRGAATVEDVCDALWGLGARSRGGAEELQFLADHPDPDVRELLYDVLESYRGKPARELRARLLSNADWL
jgi:hypothetical protein